MKRGATREGLIFPSIFSPPWRGFGRRTPAAPLRSDRPRPPCRRPECLSDARFRSLSLTFARKADPASGAERESRARTGSAKRAQEFRSTAGPAYGEGRRLGGSRPCEGRPRPAFAPSMEAAGAAERSAPPAGRGRRRVDLRLRTERRPGPARRPRRPYPAEVRPCPAAAPAAAGGRTARAAVRRLRRRRHRRRPGRRPRRPCRRS